MPHPPSPFVEELLRTPGGMISLTGAGGKTSLMFHLAAQLTAAGMRVLTTTTTRIFRPRPDQSPRVLVDPDPHAVIAEAGRLGRRGHVTAAAAVLPEGGKLRGYGLPEIEVLEASGAFDWILVEADGSARRPLKAADVHEPVVPPGTTLHLAVAGLDAVGAPLGEERVFRSVLAAPRMGLSLGDRITAGSVARLAVHPEGFFKGRPPGARRGVFLNKADDPVRRATGERIAELVLGDPIRGPEFVLVGQALEVLRIHSAHPPGEGA